MLRPVWLKRFRRFRSKLWWYSATVKALFQVLQNGNGEACSGWINKGGSTGSGVCLSFRCSKSPDAPLPLAVRAKVILTCSDSLYIYIYIYIHIIYSMSILIFFFHSDIFIVYVVIGASLLCWKQLIPCYVNIWANHVGADFPSVPTCFWKKNGSTKATPGKDYECGESHYFSSIPSGHFGRVYWRDHALQGSCSCHRPGDQIKRNGCVQRRKKLHFRC